jgi:ATP/maltotriose-dependent transcriptional regulator MalT
MVKGGKSEGDSSKDDLEKMNGKNAKEKEDDQWGRWDQMRPEQVVETENDYRTVLAGKLRPPRLRQVLLRSRLIKQATPGSKLRMVNICAGAGFGKTTLMAQIAQAFEGNYVWYQIDSLDQDPAMFVRHLIAGISDACALDIRRTQSRMIETTNFSCEGESIFAVFLDELREQSDIPLLICFDDFHLFDSADRALYLVDFLVQNLADNLSVVITSRTIPKLTFGRLRAHGILCDLGESDLEFSFDELSDLMGAWNIEATDAALQQAYKSTEGWVAGLVLTESYLRSGNEVPDFFAQQRLQQNVYEYLAEEVLHNQPKETRDFLMAVALIDPIEPVICQEALAIPHAAQMLEAVEQNNLFTSRLDDSNYYRYHPLFREFLLTRLQVEAGKQSVNQTRGKFAEVFVAAGKDRQAIEQYLDAGFGIEAVSLIEKVGDDMLDHAEYETLELWINSLDDKSLNINMRLFQALVLMSYGKYRQALKILRAIDPGEDSHDVTLLCKTRLATAECLRALAQNKEALKILSPLLNTTMNPKIRLEVLLRLASCHWSRFDHDELTTCSMLAGEIICEGNESPIKGHGFILAMDLLRQGDFNKALYLLNQHVDSDKFNEGQKNIFMNNLASCLMLTGNYQGAKSVIDKCWNRVEKQNELKMFPIVLDTFGCILIAEGDYEKGESLLKKALQKLASIEQSRNDHNAATLCHLGTFARRSGDYDRALECHTKSSAIARPLNELYEVAVSTANIGSDLVRMSKFSEAEKYFSEAEALSLEHDMRYVQTQIDFNRAWAAHMQENKKEERLQLSSALRRAREFQHNHFIIQESRLALPLMRTALEDGIEPDYVCWILKHIGEESLATIEPVLVHDNAFIREKIAVLLADIDSTSALTLLRRMRYDSDERVQQIVRSSLSKVRQNLNSVSDILTAREVDVLKCLSQGKTNRQIADELFISEPTVKTHLARIFRKLGFTNRLDAALYYRQTENKFTTLHD